MISRHKNCIIRCLPVLILVLILSGCGQKGALYLPDPESAVQEM